MEKSTTGLSLKPGPSQLSGWTWRIEAPHRRVRYLVNPNIVVTPAMPDTSPMDDQDVVT